jgi:cytosine/adenosine deaminase-related metal-dependent hydrolase
MTAAALRIENVRPMGGPLATLFVTDGRFAASAPPDAPVIDGQGALLLPGLVEAHTHLDKSLLGMPWYRNEVGPSLWDKIDNERAVRRTSGIDPARQSMRHAAQTVGFGTTAIRSHVDVDIEVGTACIAGVMATREALRDVVDIKIVAFPQSGLLVKPGTLALLEEALRMGAEIVGGLDPCAIDRDPKGHLDAIFGLAEKYGRPVDIHLHEPGEMGAFSLELIAERTRALGMQGRVVISHAFCLGVPDPDTVDRLLALLAETDIAIITTAPASRPVPPVKRVLAAGVRMAAGSDGFRDTWGPYGNGDMLERATLIGLRNNLRRDDELDLALGLVTTGGASVMGLEGYGLETGCRADCVLVPAETRAEAVGQKPPRALVLKGGRVVGRDNRPAFEITA